MFKLTYIQSTIILAIILLLSTSFTTETNYSNTKREILHYTNQYRKTHHLPPLKEIDYLDNIAQKHSQDMASAIVGFGHKGFKNRTALIKKHFGMVATGENVAYGKLSAKEVVRTWVNSPPHRKNLLGNYNYIGIGIARNRNGILFFTQVFVKSYKNIP